MRLRQAWNQCSNLFAAHKVENGRATARLLLMHLMQYTFTQFITSLEQELAPAAIAELQQLSQQIVLGKPLQYITGQQEFMGLNFDVDENVLIPRPETELLVSAVLTKLNCHNQIKIADIGTGSGAVIISLATKIKQAICTAVDISKAALAVARKNARRHQVAERITFLQGDLLNPLLPAVEKYHIIVSNPPYLSTDRMKSLPLNVRQEPALALYGGVDGLDCYRRLTADAPKLLKNGGHLVVEIDCNQAKAVASLFKANKFLEIEILSDYAGLDRFVVGKCQK